MRRIITALVLFVVMGQAFAQAVRVEGVRFWAGADKTRVVFDLSGPADHRLFSLSAPERLVIDMDRASMTAVPPQFDDATGAVRNIRSGVRDGQDLRIVLDLSRSIRPNSFVMGPSGDHGHRLVVDLLYESSVDPVLKAAVKLPEVNTRRLVVAIDAGHGGKDPGAIGRYRTQEKDVVLAIARELKGVIQSDPGMKAVMIRDGDYFLPLRQRIEKARQHGADIFVSIHADAFHRPDARGSSVYVLSDRGASDEAARWLAERENAADLVGGVSLSDKDDLLKHVLLDLSQTATIDASLGLGEKVLGELGDVGRLHKSDVQQAGFVVLKSPDIPSILVETAFLSNPTEEKKLRSVAHQRKIAQAIYVGIRQYAVERMPEVLFANGFQQHKVARGETLSHIAERYRVSLSTLRDVNEINGDRIRVGEVLRIPSANEG
ncbi:MAG: N-acetylmuramoyl-L-alanine amidase [Pseudomonadota bacterium]|nr:N-acetylmuramoyl-L-alanine amidase [Pseudomonadota bacterium]